ncbi:Protein yippee-like [Apostasia shenzhenica]|uniref:Protein yippee-like n=1 Tax=Apostasia shenzhenica TaxID=1088818 RepID=A0A2I0AAJ7_9ASPA|nr:Protein yippee-like [Apostasia shenzhenica]
MIATQEQGSVTVGPARSAQVQGAGGHRCHCRMQSRRTWNQGQWGRWCVQCWRDPVCDAARHIERREKRENLKAGGSGREPGMGRIFTVELDGRIYRCRYCRTHLAVADDLISRGFFFNSLWVLINRAEMAKGNLSFLGASVLTFAWGFSSNICLGVRVERMMLSGMHTVADIFCCFCGQNVGWKYAEGLHASLSPSLFLSLHLPRVGGGGRGTACLLSLSFSCRSVGKAVEREREEGLLSLILLYSGVRNRTGSAGYWGRIDDTVEAEFFIDLRGSDDEIKLPLRAAGLRLLSDLEQVRMLLQNHR